MRMLLIVLVQLGSSDPVKASLDADSGRNNPIEVIWETPDAAPKGIFFAAHGCQHSASDFWWSSDETCSGCLGLPEELRIVKAALSRGLIFVAVSSADRASKCWSGADDARVRAALTHVVSKIPGSEKLPVFAF